MAANFIEYVESESPGQAGFSMEGGRATLALDVVAAELDDAIGELLGSCRAAGDGRLARTLPLAHPQFPSLFCERISNIQGLGPKSGRSPADAAMEAPPLPFYQEYTRYRLTCEFMQRPYAVVSDVSTGAMEEVEACADDGVSYTWQVAREWLRYVDVQTDAKPELITAQQGEMVYARDDALPPHWSSFPAFPRIYLPNGLVKMRWFQVPESYVRSRYSHLRKWIGRVNQLPFMHWEKGELLYLGFTQKRYTPPVPNRVPIDAEEPEEGEPEPPVVFWAEKLVDLELLFDETVREAGAPFTPTNGSWVAAGHNLQAWIGDRQFYYVGNKTTTPGLPVHLSIPDLGLLFTDPDLEQEGDA